MLALGRWAAVFIGGICVCSTLAGAASITFLGFADPYDISTDGKTVVGLNYSVGGGIWQDGSFRPMSGPAPYVFADPFGISADSRTLVGASWTGATGASQATRWNGTSNAELLAGLPGGTHSAGQRCSADGSIVAGYAYESISRRYPVRWTTKGISKLDGGTPYYSGAAESISANGSVIVGWVTFTASDLTRYPFTWTETGGIQLLSTSRGTAAATSPDGSIIVGDANDQAFRWTQQGGMQMLGFLDPDSSFTYSYATAMSADGSIVVGSSYLSDLDDEVGFIWDAEHGMRSLTTLAGNLGLDLRGSVIYNPRAISADGQVITGTAMGAHGQQGFILVLPEPTAATMLILAPAWLMRRRRITLSSASDT